VIQRLMTFYREVVVEMGKVSWPSYEELRTSTIIVLMVTIIFAVFTGMFDWFLSLIVQWFLQ
jgi:preprotein translocase subunit SecE